MYSIVGQPLHLEINMKMYFPKQILPIAYMYPAVGKRSAFLLALHYGG